MGYVSCDHRAELCFMCMTLSFSLEYMVSVVCHQRAVVLNIIV